MSKNWLDSLNLKQIKYDSFLSTLPKIDVNKRVELEIKICGLCESEFIPRTDASRLICYSEKCENEYNKAKRDIVYDLQQEILHKKQREKEEQERLSNLPTPRINNGYVYLMQSGNGYYKIGISTNIEQRIYGIKRQFPVKIEVVHYFACYEHRKVEKYLHNKYSSKRIEYEWFQLDTKDIEWIKSINDFDLDHLV